MEVQAYRDEIKLKITGGILDLELDDTTLDKIINASLREVQRYIDSTKIITTNYSKCIDFNELGIKVNSVTNIYRSNGFTENENASLDPMLASQWQLLSGVGNLYNMQNYVLNYASWNSLLQSRNTTSTDLLFKFDKSANKLYINIAMSNPESITIEYVPRFDSVEEIESDFWIDVIMKMSIALTKVTLGRIRSRYTQANALWTQDGQTMLEEGNSELSAIRDKLQTSTNLMYPVD